MRIEKLRFKNLNSLTGEWEIDFSAFEGEGLFAITGTTGAGKSTILDAICLALYGKTPRLTSVNKSNNEIMSRLRGDCYAELEFETKRGRFRCTWSQHRAGKKSSGNLQMQKHEIANLETGAILEEKASLVEGKVEEYTGLSFNQFTRSILLAQGDFDAFLKARSEEKAPILEQITRTEIYGEISKAVHQRSREEKLKFSALEEEHKRNLPLSDSEFQEIKSRVDSDKQARQLQQDKERDLRKFLDWQNELASLRNKVKESSDRAEILRNKLEQFVPKRMRLELASKAVELEGTFTALAGCRERAEKLQKDKLQVSSELIEYREKEKEQAQNRESRKKVFERQREDSEKMQPILKELRALEQFIETLQKQFKAKVEEEELSRSELIKAAKALTEIEESLTTANRELAISEQFLAQHSEDEKLIFQIEVIEHELNTLTKNKGEIFELESVIERAREKISKLRLLEKEQRILFEKKISVLDELENQLESEKNTREGKLKGRSLEDYRREKDSLQEELLLRTQIMELSDRRKQLQDGSPCPLCGSHDHPYARGNLPQIDSIMLEINELTAFIKDLEQLDSSILERERKIAREREDLLRIENSVKEAQKDRERSEENEQELVENRESLIERMKENDQLLIDKLSIFGVKEIPSSAATEIAQRLRQRLKRWEKENQKKLEIEKRLIELEKDKAVSNTLYKEKEENHKKAEETKHKNKAELEDKIKDKSLRFENLRADEEENRQKLALQKAENDLKDAESLHNEILTQRHLYEDRETLLIKEIHENNAVLLTSIEDFENKLQQKGFINEEAFLASRLESVEREALAQEKKKLDESISAENHLLEDYKKQLQTLAEKALTTKSIEEINLELEESDSISVKLVESISLNEKRLEEDTALRQKQAVLMDKLEMQRIEFERWEKLREHIGSEDGKKFRIFAQSLTLDVLIAKANAHLSKMRDRYVLKREGSSLELLVIDNYQAGEQRSVKTLSGGESFIISLALALGLSGMASNNISVDSLFLDEGFGTLDEESLEIALNAIAQLRQENKLIGLISHVATLNERIGMQIQVKSSRGGEGELFGPGCKRLGD